MPRTKKLFPHTPDWVSLPGDTLLEIIEYKGITQKELAERTGVTPKHINQIVKGIAPIMPDMAIRLERVTGTSAKFWNTLEANFQIRKAQVKAKKKLLENREILKIPAVLELIKRGEVPFYEDESDQIEAVLGFYGVGSVKKLKERWKIPQQVALRHSPKFKSDPIALATWIRLGEKKAESMQCQPFDKSRFRAVLEEIRKLTTQSPKEFTEKMQQLCASAGVALVFVKEFEGATVYGATKWLTPKKAVILLNLRGKKNDQFWFSFFHEAAHVLFDGTQALFINAGQDGNEKNEHEKKADQFACEILIPSKNNAVLKNLKSHQDVTDFARKIGIAPGIVVGRLQRDGIVPYSYLNKLKATYSWC